MILGSGPNRIGQGIEFDYCCVHAAMTVRESGRDAVMVNCNPETVSTDYDTSDRLYFEPLTLEDVLAIVEVEQPEGVIVQFGGQTPLKLAAGLEAAGVPLLGTQPEAIDLAEDRGRFGAAARRARAAARRRTRTAHSAEEALAAAPGIGWPLLVRPSYVLGGRAMEIVYDLDGLRDYLRRVNGNGREIFLDRFLENAIEVDVDAICDGEDVWIGGIMQHVEEAGIHSGDSACVLPPHSLGAEMLGEIREATRRIALALGTVGLINVQYGVLGDDLYVIEANPRASRTVPFVSKATGLPLAKLACRVMLGEKLAAHGPAGRSRRRPRLGQGGGAAVRPLRRRRRAARPRDALDRRGDGRRRRLPGRVRQGAGRGRRAAAARRHRVPHRHRHRQVGGDGDRRPAARPRLPDRRHPRHRRRRSRGWGSRSSGSTRSARARRTWSTGSRTATSTSSSTRPTGTAARTDGYEIRRAAVARGIPCITTIAGGMAAARAIAAARSGEPAVVSLQELHAQRDGGARDAARSASARAAALGPHARCRRSSAPSYGPYVVLTVGRPRRARRPIPGQFYMLTAAERWGGERTSARSCRGRSASCARATATLDFLLEDVGPGTNRLAELGARRRAAACSARSATASRRPRDGRRPILVGGGVGIAPLAIWGDALERRRRRCSASATPPTPRARR